MLFTICNSCKIYETYNFYVWDTSLAPVNESSIVIFSLLNKLSCLVKNSKYYSYFQFFLIFINRLRWIILCKIVILIMILGNGCPRGKSYHHLNGVGLLFRPVRSIKNRITNYSPKLSWKNNAKHILRPSYYFVSSIIRRKTCFG